MATVSETAHRQAFDNWKDHTSERRVDTEFVVQQTLQAAYPEHHVTRFKKSSTDLFGYASAGHATLTPAINDPVLYDATRTFSMPGPAVCKVKGKLTDEVKFGCWHCNWQDHTFIVYQTIYVDAYMRTFQDNYILKEKESHVDAEGHHTISDTLLLAAGEWTKALHNEIYVFDDARWRKSKELFKSVQDASWDDVILEPVTKTNLMQDVQSFFDNRELYTRMRVPWKRGVILHGVPGNGKTISLKALINAIAAREEPVPSLYVKSLDSCSGPKWSIQQIFSHARLMAPCLLIFEDLDSMVEDKTRSYFLNEVDGLESNEGILMIGSTNHLDRLDAAITKRPSRFDRKYHFKVPREAERIAYCRYWSSKFPDAEAVGITEDIFEIVAKITDGWSFAYLKELFVTSLLAIAHGQGDQDSEEDATEGEEQRASGSDSGSSTSDTVVVETPTSPTEREQTTVQQVSVEITAEVAGEEKKEKKTMPEVEIPESVRGNAFLKVMLKQAKMLWDQMDNSEEEALEMKKKAGGVRTVCARPRMVVAATSSGN